MTGPRLTRILATSALAATLAGSIAPSQAMPLPVTSAQEIAGAAPTEHVQWWGGYGWRGYGWGWRRPYYGGGALAAGLIGGLALGTLAASAGSYYGYGYYPSSYSYPAYSYGYYPSSYAYPSYYSYPGYYRTAYYGTSYGLGYGSAYWASGKRGHKHARKPVHR